MSIHPNTPPKLVKLLHKAGSFHKTAEAIGVNVYWVYKLVREGKEPTDRTPKGRETRHRLGLHKYKQRHTQRRPRTRIQKAITRMVKETRKAVLL